MNPKRIFNLIFTVVIILVLVGLGIKLAKKIHRHFTKPRLFDTQKLLSEIKPLAGQEGLKVFVASSLDRIFLNGKTLLKPAFTSTASISAAGNEYESFQVVVSSAQRDLPGVHLETSDLVNPQTGGKISHDHFTWRVVGYVPTLTPYYPVKYVGLWPDPLIPVNSYDVKAGTTQPFWLTVYVPPQTPAGDYTGTVKIEGQGLAAQNVPVKLHVYGFTLPKEDSLKTAFDFYPQLTKIRYPQGEDESSEAWQARLGALNEKYIITMLQYRMDPILNIDPSSQTDLARVDRYKVFGLNNFAIGKHGGTFDNNWPRDTASIEKLFDTYRGYGEDLKLNNFLDDTYIYTWDEGKIGNPIVPKIAGMIHRAYPKLKNMVCYHGFWDPDQDPNWGKDIDIWTFQIDDFNEAQMRKLQSHGMELWMYVSGPGGTGSPNLAMDFDSIDYRIIPWICWKYDIRGFLYWCVNWWPSVDPFKNARNTKWEQNGNGLLFYPGKDGPIASLRMEIFRDGMEDYEYIQLLLHKLQFIKSKGLEARFKKEFDESIRLLTMDNTLVRSPFSFTKDNDYLKRRRDEIAQEIEKLDFMLKQ